MPRNLPDIGRPRQAKASLDGQSLSIALTEAVKEALRAHFGSLKAACIEMGGMDEGQLNRELKSGDFKLLKRLEEHPAALALVSEAIRRVVGPVDPKEQARRLIREGRRVLDALAEVVA